MDYVYLCRDGENEELRYSIRSVIANGLPSSIWVVGGKPDWYSGNFIDVIQDKNKFENQVNNLKHVCLNEHISNDFILMNDDFYILKPSKEYKYFDGLLIDKIDSHSQKYGNSAYARTLRRSFKALGSKGIHEPLNYEVHMPMALNKAKLAQVLDLSLSPRSLYGNIFISDGVELKDVKVYKDTSTFDMSANLISSEDNSFNLIKDQLHEMFPNPSEFEL